MKFNLIVAVCRNNGIGYKGDIPWHIKADLQYFSKLTKGNGKNAIVMGHNTWLSLQQHGFSNGLPGRDNFIFSHKQRFTEVSAIGNNLIKTFGSYDEFQVYNISHPYDEIWIIGGAQLYKTFLEKGIINKCYITYIDKDFECDTFLPSLEPSEWALAECLEDFDVKYNCAIKYTVYEQNKI
jgi:dihydrofolate reductase